jgi:hypothetical protein
LKRPCHDIDLVFGLSSPRGGFDRRRVYMRFEAKKVTLKIKVKIKVKIKITIKVK